MSSAEGESLAPVIADGSHGSTASGIENKDLVEDDDLYCIDSAFVFFQVERRIFHIPTYRFTKESQFFAGMFQLPQSANEDVEGSTRQNPIMLPNNITYPDFHNFLKALYPLPVSTQLVLSRDEWLSVLRLSTFWYFLEYRKMAISQLEKVGAFSPIDQVLYGREYRVHSWVRQGFEQLITRENPIEKEDAHLINFETTFSLFRLRERRTKCLSSGFLSTFNTSDEVHQTFKTELEDIIKDEVACKTVEQEIMFEETSLPSKRPADDSFEGLWGVPEPTTMTTTVPTGLGKKKKKHYGKSW